MPDESVLGGTAGVPILGDLIGANFAQRVKLDLGADGATAPVVGTMPISGNVGVSGNVEIVNDVGNPLPVSGVVGHDNTAIADGRKIVTTAGTRVALASSTPAKSVVITAETDNTGVVVVGAAATVVAVLATRVGIPLAAGDTIILPVDNLTDVGLDSTVSGDGVTFVYTS